MITSEILIFTFISSAETSDEIPGDRRNQVVRWAEGWVRAGLRCGLAPEEIEEDLLAEYDWLSDCQVAIVEAAEGAALVLVTLSPVV